MHQTLGDETETDILECMCNDNATEQIPGVVSGRYHRGKKIYDNLNVQNEVTKSTFFPSVEFLGIHFSLFETKI